MKEWISPGSRLWHQDCFYAELADKMESERGHSATGNNAASSKTTTVRISKKPTLVDTSRGTVIATTKPAPDPTWFNELLEEVSKDSHSEVWRLVKCLEVLKGKVSK